MENVDFGELLGALAALGAGIVAVGAVVSRWTKTPKDDAFFRKVGKAFGLKKVDE